MKELKTHKKARPVTAIILSIACIWAMSGHSLWTATRNVCYNYVRTKKLQKNKTSDTIVISGNSQSADIIWVKKDEIRYKGSMFDIKHIVEKEGFTLLIGHYDGFEDKLFSTLYKLLKRDENSPAQDSPPTQLFAVTGSSPFNLRELIFNDIHTPNTLWKNPFNMYFSNAPSPPPPDRFPA